MSFTIKGPTFDYERAARMAEQYKSGKTLHEIGVMYSMTRERVRQILKRIGVTRLEGGAKLKADLRAAAKKAAGERRRDARNHGIVRMQLR